MKYVNATEVIPEELLEKLQDFIQGEYLYIPVKKGGRKSWGELSGYRAEIADRNNRICEAYLSGMSIEEIAEAFFLSIHAIRKIVYEK